MSAERSNDTSGWTGNLRTKVSVRPPRDKAARPLPERWMVLVTCRDERHQAALLDRFAAEGLECKALIG